MTDRTLETKPSEEATYAGQREFGIVAGRTHVEIAPKYGGDFIPGDIIRLEIPAQAYMDPNEFYIHFRTGIIAGAEQTAVGDLANGHGVDTTSENILNPIYPSQGSSTAAQRTKTVQFVSGIQSIFNRVRLLAGSVVLEDIQDYNVLYRMLMDTTVSKEWRKTDGFMCEGLYDPEDYEQRRHNANFHSANGVAGAFTSGPGHFYSVRPLLGLLTAGKYIPLKYMGQLTLELYLESANECLWSTSSVSHAADVADATDVRRHWNHTSATGIIPSNRIASNYNVGTEEFLGFMDDTAFAVSTDFPNATYRVHDVRMHVPFVHPVESYDQAMMRQIETGDIAIHHSSWSTHTRQISAPSRQTLSFQERALSLKGALACMRNSPDIRAIDADFVFPANGIQAYQWKIGSEYIPAQEVSCINGSGRALAELRKALGTYGDDQLLSYITEYNFLPQDLPHQLDSFYSTEVRRGASQPSSFFMALDLERSKGQQSGFDSAASSVDIELNLTLANHATLVGATDGTYDFRGAEANAKWQPSKKRVVFTGTGNLPFETDASRHISDGSIATFSNSTNTNAATTHVFNAPHCPEGVMQDKNLRITAGERAQNAGSTEPVYADRSTGVYSRVYLFAHIDQVLRLSAIGRMEIVR